MEDLPRDKQKSIFELGLADDFYYNLARAEPKELDTLVAVSLPVYCADACLPGPDHKDTLSVLAGSFKRIGAAPPINKKQLHIKIREVRRFAKRFIFKRFKQLEEEDILPTTEWIGQINQPERRKAELLSVFEELKTKNIWSDPTDPSFEKPTYTGSFVKDEKYPDYKAPRWINASSDEVKVLYGPVADAIMKRLCENKSFIKTVPVAERADAIYNDLFEENSEYCANDYTSFEAHFDKIRMMLWHDFIIYMCSRLHMSRFMNDIKIKEVLEAVLQPGLLEAFLNEVIRGRRFCSMRHFGYVAVVARRCSGEMDTSGGNGYSNYVMTQFVGWILTLRAMSEFPTKVEGDDSLTRYPEGIRPTDALMAEYGWHTKIEVHKNLATASFCGLIFDPIDRISVCDIRKTLLKFWTNRRYVRASPACLKGLLRAKALSFACEYGNVPIIGVLAHRILYLTRTVNIRKSIIDTMEQYEREKLIYAMKQKPWKNKPHTPYNTRCLVEDLYGIDIDTQLKVEERLSQIELGPFSIPEINFHPVLDHNLATNTSTNPNRFIEYNFQGRARLIALMIELVQTLPDSVELGNLCLRKETMIEQLRLLLDPREASNKNLKRIKYYKNFRRALKRAKRNLADFNLYTK